MSMPAFFNTVMSQCHFIPSIWCGASASTKSWPNISAYQAKQPRDSRARERSIASSAIIRAYILSRVLRSSLSMLSRVSGCLPPFFFLLMAITQVVYGVGSDGRVADFLKRLDDQL